MRGIGQAVLLKQVLYHSCCNPLPTELPVPKPRVLSCIKNQSLLYANHADDCGRAAWQALL